MATDKKGKAFMSFDERKIFLENLKGVDEVISFEDDEGKLYECIEKIKLTYPDDQIIFCNGGDRGKENIPEMSIKDIEFEFGVGGDDKKIQVVGF